jgi:alpha-1,6-mannosyltransferase
MPPRLPRVRAATRLPVARAALVVGVLSGCLLALADGRRIWGPHLAFEGVAFVCFVCLLALEARRRWLTARLVAGAGAVLLVLAVTFPPSESADVWAYVMYGRITAIHDSNPYVAAPASFPGDRWLALVRPIWRDSRSLYGPVFQVAAGAVVRSAQGSALRARLGFQILAALTLAGILGLVWWRTRDPPAVALLALNPLVVIGVVNGAHPDALVSLAVLGAVLLSERGRSGAGAFVLGLGAMVKVVALLPAAVLALWTWRRRGPWAAVGSAGVTATVVAGGYLLFGGTAAVRALGSESGLTNRFALWRLAWWIRPVLEADGERHLVGAAAWVTMGLLLGLAVLAAIPALRDAGPGRAVSLALAVYLLGGLYVQPWYVMWLLPLAALAWRSPLARIAVGFQAALTLAYALALHKHLGSAGLTARTGYFVALSLGEAAAILTLVTLGILEMRRRRPAALSPGGLSGGPARGP